MNIDIGQLIIWLLIGFVAGTLASWLIRGRKRGFGRLGNLIVGLVGAIVGGFVFKALNINLGLPTLTFKLDDVVAAFAGSLIVIGLVYLIRR